MAGSAAAPASSEVAWQRVLDVESTVAKNKEEQHRVVKVLTDSMDDKLAAVYAKMKEAGASIGSSTAWSNRRSVRSGPADNQKWRSSKVK